MSETEHYIGKLKPTGKRLREYIRDANIPETYSLDEYLEEHYCEIAYVIDGLVFEVLLSNNKEYEDIFIATKNDDGSIDFQVKYHNGSCGFNEAIDNAIKTIN